MRLAQHSILSFFFVTTSLLLVVTGDGDAEAAASSSSSTGGAPPPKTIRLSNWGGNFQFSTMNINYPRSADELVELVTTAGGVRPLHALGSRHSMSTIADSDQMLVSLSEMNHLVALNPPNGTAPATVVVEAGMIYTDLVPFIEYAGLALPMLASIAEVTIAGACSTGTHGASITNPNLATHLRSVQMVLANGSRATFTKGVHAEFNAVALGLGALGIITQVELELVPSFQLTRSVFLNLPMATLSSNFMAIMSAAYTIHLWTDWSDTTNIDQVWVGNRPGDAVDYANASTFFGATRAVGATTPVAELPPTYLVQQGTPGPWHERLTDFRLGLSGANGDRTQSEYILPIGNAVAAIQAIAAISTQIRPLLYITLFRAIAADDLWMSPTRNQDSFAIHFTWKPGTPAVLTTALPAIEAALAPLGAVPHWGKVFTMAPSAFLAHYPQLGAFKQLAAQLDPTGRFRNAFLNENLFADIDK